MNGTVWLLIITPTQHPGLLESLERDLRPPAKAMADHKGSGIPMEPPMGPEEGVTTANNTAMSIQSCLASHPRCLVLNAGTDVYSFEYPPNSF